MLPELNIKQKLGRSRRTVKQQMKAYRVTEAIASRDHNNLYITSSFFMDRMKYKAFCAFYAVMRLVDDRIDNLPLSNKQNEESQKGELSVAVHTDFLLPNLSIVKTFRTSIYLSF
jgi:hypothetical protein